MGSGVIFLTEPALWTSAPETAEEAGQIPAATEKTEQVPVATAQIQETAEPQPVPDAGNSQLLWGGLAVAFALLAAAVIALLHKRSGREPQPQTTSPVPPVTASKPQTTSTVPSVTVPKPQELVEAAAPEVPPVQVAYYQHIGTREDQQDSYAVSNPAAYDRQGVLAVVADGMGGLSNGGAVSAAVVRSFMDTFRSTQAAPGDVLLEAAAHANAYVNQMLRGGEKSGSTLVAAILRGGWLNFLSVGDSRIYLYRGGALLQLNREHAFREELAVRVVNQEAPISRVRGDRQSHALTSYFGIGTIPHIDRNDEPIRLLPGDRLLLASDGVFGVLPGQRLEALLRLELSEAVREIESLIRQANLPHQDNNTAVILEFNG